MSGVVLTCVGVVMCLCVWGGGAVIKWPATAPSCHSMSLRDPHSAFSVLVQPLPTCLLCFSTCSRTDKVVVACASMQADYTALQKLLQVCPAALSGDRTGSTDSRRLSCSHPGHHCHLVLNKAGIASIASLESHVASACLQSYRPAGVLGIAGSLQDNS